MRDKSLQIKSNMVQGVTFLTAIALMCIPVLHILEQRLVSFLRFSSPDSNVAMKSVHLPLPARKMECRLKIRDANIEL